MCEREKNEPCLTTMPVGTWMMGRLVVLAGLRGRVPGVPGGGEALALPTEPGSLNPWGLFSSGPSKKLRLNSLPASKDTSGVRVSGAGALPRPAVSDCSILNTSIVRAIHSRGCRRCTLYFSRFPFFFLIFFSSFNANSLLSTIPFSFSHFTRSCYFFFLFSFYYFSLLYILSFD